MTEAERARLQVLKQRTHRILVAVCVLVAILLFIDSLRPR
jgi:hypothetical protein